MGKTYMTADALCAASRAMVGKYTYDQVDCIRVIQNPLEEAGAKFPYTGSNWFARNEVSNLRRLTSQSQLRPGVALFRSKEPNESGYKLPDRYMKGESLYSAALGETDFHHIGLMLDQGEIVDSNKDSKRNGPAISTNWQAWEWVADIDYVDYSDVYTSDSEKGGEKAMNTAVVKVEGGGALNFRQGPGKNYDLCFKYKEIPTGDTLEILESNGEWARASYRGETGWVAVAHLVIGASGSTGGTGISGNTPSNETVSIPRATAEAFYSTLGNLLGKN